ncbi:hypothetical protein ISN44_As10g024750 [Arabidopsis suecica]|uniref:Uncharacterized protein n=1 Tax=Arabidopsis suecica TaxID=45249 RepID=A0A8T2A0Q0_ARASU|nr:hypothetical protein ISN44_As10g024750 [Arabidopsis suecica]
MKKKKGNGSKPSLSCLMSSIYDSLHELPQLTSILRIDGDVSITGLIAIVASFQSLELQLQAMKDLLRQRKEAIPKGKISSFFYLPTLLEIKLYKHDVDSIQGPISLLTEGYTNMARTLYPELFSDDINTCLIQEDANNGISFETVVLSPSPTEEILQNNQLQNEPEPLRRESKTESNWFGNKRWIGSCMKGKERI